MSIKFHRGIKVKMLLSTVIVSTTDFENLFVDRAIAHMQRTPEIRQRDKHPSDQFAASQV